MSSFSTVSHSLSLFSYCTLWKKVTVCSPYLKYRDLFFISFRWNVYIYYLEFFCTEFLSFFLFLSHVINLHQFEFMNFFFLIFWVIIQYFNFLLKLFQLWPWAALSASIWYTPIIVFLWALPYFLTLQDALSSSCKI